MTWIKTVDYEEADQRLMDLYDRVKGPNGQIDQILMAHSLRPHTLVGHMTLYKNVLHHHSNALPKWYLETIGVFVSQLNSCDYCVQHHFHGLKNLLQDSSRADAILTALKSESPESCLEPKWCAGLEYAKALTQELTNIDASTIQGLRDSGFEDGEILEVNQVVAYFNYANRTVLGLGVSIGGEVLGLSPSNDQDETNWGHREASN